MDDVLHVKPEDVDRLYGFTWWQIVAALGVWLAIYAACSLFIQNPFFVEQNASADIIFRNIMYLHGFLIGFAGLTCLVAAEVMQLTSKKTRIFILWLTVFATIVGCVSGIFNTNDKTVFWLSAHIVSFFAFDAIALLLLYAVWHDRKRAKELKLSMPFWTEFIAVIALIWAAVMGHIAGWVLTFGDFPFHIVGGWSKLMGERIPTFMANMTASHSHEMVVAFLALIVATTAWRFGYNKLSNLGKTLSCIGMWLVCIGTVLMTIIYVVGGFTNLEPPTLFAFGPGGVNGLAGDDLVTGVGVMLGGFLVLLTLIFAKRLSNAEEPLWTKKILSYLAWLWGCLVVTVVMLGYSIEFNETYFGAGDPKALGAKSDALYSSLHQNFAFFLLPALMITLLALNALFDRKKQEVSGIEKGLIVFGSILACMGIIVFIFVTPTAVFIKKIGWVPIASFSSGYIILSAGMIIIFTSFLWVMKDLWIHGRTGINHSKD